MIINISYDQNPNTLPNGFTAGVSTVVQFFQNQFTDSISFNLHVGYGEVNGEPLRAGNLGQSHYTFNTYSYSQLRDAFLTDSKSGDDATAARTLPSSDPTGGGHILVVQTEAAAFGLLPSNTVIDTYVGFSNTETFSYGNTGVVPAGQFDFFGIVAHEISEVMGRELAVGQTIAGFSNSYYPLDLFHYSTAGVRNFVGTQAGYFSLDGGVTNLNNFNTNPSDDFGDWAVNAGNDSFRAFSNSGVVNSVAETDLRLMDILGYNRASPVSTVSAATIQNDNLAIIRTALPLDQATTVANAINAGTQTETQYVNSLLTQVANTTIPAVTVEASMYGATGTSAEITSLTNNFLPAQVANATKFGLNAQVYSCEALGLVFAFGNENSSTAFANNFGPSNNAMPNTTVGDAAFAAAASTEVFGSASTANLVNVMQGFIGNWKAFFTANGVIGIPNASAAQVDLAARGAAWGDMVGVALANNLGPLNGQVINFLQDAAQGTAVYGTALASQPPHGSFQGGAAAGAAAVASGNVNIVGVSGELDAHPT